MAKLKGNPVDDLVKNVLLEEKGGSNFATTEWYTLRYEPSDFVSAGRCYVCILAQQPKQLSLIHI